MPSIVNSQKVFCPECDGLMTKRKSARGEFWGCADFPRCRGIRKVGEETRVFPKVASKYAPFVKAPGTHEQEAIWECLLKEACHVVVNAGPGVGKTWSMGQYCLRAPRGLDILFAAFNKHIAREAEGKFRATKLGNVFVKTSHSWGNGVCRAAFPRWGEPDEGKMPAIFEQMYPAPLTQRGEWRRKVNMMEKLASFVKNYLIDYRASDFRERAEWVLDHHNVDVNGNLDLLLDMVPRGLDVCKERAAASGDYDDMLWLPVVLDLPVKYPAQVAIIDEFQDLNELQHALVMKMVGRNGRVVVVGDRRQAINEFRGAKNDSIDAFAARLAATERGVKEFPMTITQRCPKLHVVMARSLYPNCAVCDRPEQGHGTDHEFRPTIQALENAPLGVIESMREEKALAEMRPGDMVLCRCNAPMISAAYSLIRRGVRPVVKGRDIGKGLITFIDQLEKVAIVIPLTKLCSACKHDGDPNGICGACRGKGFVRDDLGAMAEALKMYRYEQESKLLQLGDKALGRLSSLADRCDCLAEFLRLSSSVPDMRDRIVDLFALNKPEDQEDDSNAVVLGTVHRTKGLEAHRVFVLAPDLIPHPAAKKDWEREQERHVAWIAATRAKFDGDHPGTIVFCGSVPPIFNDSPRPPVEEEEFDSDELFEADDARRETFEESVIDSVHAAVDPYASAPLRERAERATTRERGLKRALDEQESEHEEIKDYGDEPPF